LSTTNLVFVNAALEFACFEGRITFQKFLEMLDGAQTGHGEAGNLVSS
jgi:hypothetical protein